MAYTLADCLEPDIQTSPSVHFSLYTYVDYIVIRSYEYALTLPATSHPYHPFSDLSLSLWLGLGINHAAACLRL